MDVSDGSAHLPQQTAATEQDAQQGQHCNTPVRIAGDDLQLGEIVVASLSYAARELTEHGHQWDNTCLPFRRGARLLVCSEVRRGHAHNLYPTYVMVRVVGCNGEYLSNARWAPRLLLRRQHVAPVYGLLLNMQHHCIIGSFGVLHSMYTDGTVLLRFESGLIRAEVASCALFDSVSDVEMIQRLAPSHPAIADPAGSVDPFACQIVRTVRAAAVPRGPTWQVSHG